MILRKNPGQLCGATLLAGIALLATLGQAAAEETDAQQLAQARQRIADVAKEMVKNAESVKQDLMLDQVPEDDVPLDLMRYATFRVAGTFFSTWSADKNLTRPDSPKCLLDASAPAGSLVTQIANDEFLVSFVQDGHLLEVASGIAEQICKTFGPQIIRPLIKQGEEGIPERAASPTQTESL